MKKLISIILALAIMATLFCCPVFTASAGQNNLKNRVIGYLPSYRSAYFNSIDYSALTHVILSFINYHNGTISCGFTDSQIRQIKANCDANDVKLMIAVGGWEGFTYSSNPIDTAEKRATLINQLMSYVDTYDLDGIDIDIEITDGNFWRYFPDFASELKTRLGGKLMTMAVAPWITEGNVSSSTYNYFDFINLMTYDYSHDNVAPMSQIYSNISTYSAAGISNDRMVIGVPFYGYKGNTAYTYSEIIAMSTSASQMDNYNGISYNGMPTIRSKAEYSLDYGGIMIWEIGQDTFDQYSLLGTIKDVYELSGASVAPVTNLTASDITYTSVKLGWTASADAARYNVYTGSTLIGSTTNTYYTVIGLDQGTSYSFRVVAVDAQGNESRGASVSATTTIDSSAIPNWDADTTYFKDDQVVYEGKIYRAKWWTQNEIPGSNTWGAWEYVGEASANNVAATGITLYKNGEAVANNGSTTVSGTASALSFTAAVTPENATNKNFTITVSNSSVASVSGTTATVTPANAAADTSVTITATSADGGFTARYTVNIDVEEQPEPEPEPDPEPEIPEAYVFKIGNQSAYWTTYDYRFATEVPCQFVDGVTYVPFRVIATAAGAQDVYYDANTSKVTITNAYDMTFVLSMNSTTCTVTAGGQTSTSTLNAAPTFIDGACCLPIRDVSNITFASVAFVEQGVDGYVVVSNSALTDDQMAQCIAAYNA